MTPEQFNQTISSISAHIESDPTDSKAYADLLSIYCTEPDDPAIHEANRALRDKIVSVTQQLIAAHRFRETEAFNIQYRRSLLLDAKTDFDAFMLYVESDREPQRRFWLPRRGILRPIADDMVRLIDGDLRLLTVSLPPGTGKTTLAIFLLAWIGGRWPDEYSVAFSHDGDILKGMYNEVLRIMNPEGEYLWHDVFPDVQLVSTNAKDMRIDLGTGSRFETFQFASIGSDNAGKVRACRLLYCDDLVGSIEQAMSKDRLDKLWTQYTTDIKQRGTGDERELHIATRWSVWDPIGRLERMEEDNPTGKAKFVSVPALDEREQSNFAYPTIQIGSFSTEKYLRLRETMEDVNWRALYMNQPIEREGQLYSDEELRRYFELPQEKADAVLAVCDTKAKGSDYCVLPVLYVYGRDAYVADVVCDNGDPGIVEERVAQMLVRHRVDIAQFESNAAGWHIAEKVQGRVRELGGFTKIVTKPTTANKETKIVVNAPTVKERFLFLDSSVYRTNKDYRRMMAMLTGYTMAGKNKHDDVPDAMAMAALYLESMETGKATAFRRPW